MNLKEFKHWENMQESYITHVQLISKDFYNNGKEMVKECLITIGEAVGFIEQKEHILELNEEAIKYALGDDL